MLVLVEPVESVLVVDHSSKVEPERVIVHALEVVENDGLDDEMVVIEPDELVVVLSVEVVVEVTPSVV